MSAEQRLRGLRRRLEDSGCDAVVLNLSVNLRYLTAFGGVFDDEPASVAVVTGAEALLLVDGRYVDAASTAASGTEWAVVRAAEDVWSTAVETLEHRAASRVALESSVSYARFTSVAKRFRGTMEPASRWVEDLRVIKDLEEIRRIEAAALLTDAAFEHILTIVAPGAVERDIALDLELWMRTNGADDVAFSPIVASGPNSALPHAQATDRILERGDLVKLDLGARVDGYCADMTRTVAIGTPSERQREIHDAVLAASEAGLAGVRAGRTGAEVDALARGVLEELGLGERFAHGLGHGVGLDVHEMPTLSPRGREPLPAGAVVTVEPGVYVPGFGGVRIEDLVVIEDDGCRRLTSSPKQLIEL